MATTIFTDYGQQLITEAIANKTTINITKIAVGDGMGAVYTPISSQTALKRETWSGPIDSVQVNPTNKNQVTFEGIVGANVGGFYIREIGLYDQTNKLVAISDFPESFKALADQYELYVRMILQTGSADVTNIIINKDMIYATKKYVDTEVSKKYTKPTTGIPKTDLESSVQSSLVKADSALQSVTKADVGLGNVDNTSDANKPVSTAQQIALNLKANIASPTFTGTPKAPTAVAGTNTTQLATTAFVKTAIDNSATTINDNIASVTQDITTHKADLVSHGVCGTASGTNTLTMTVTLDPSVTSYPTFMLVAFKNTTANTGAVTLNINNLGAKSIKKANGNDLSSGNLKAGGLYQVRYDGSNFILLGEGGEYGTALASDVRKTKTLGTENGVVQGTLDLSNLIAGNVKKGISIDGVIGTLDIASLGGKNYASGALLSSVANKTFGFSMSSGKTVYPYISVNSLTFKPTVIIALSFTEGVNYNTVSMTVFRLKSDGYYSDVASVVEFNSSSGSATMLKANSNDGYINNTGFLIPVSKSSAQYYWEAFG